GFRLAGKPGRDAGKDPKIRWSQSAGKTLMNTANLQLEGLYLALASINNLLVRKGLLTVEEIDEALRRAEANALGDDRSTEDWRPANRDAVCFPIRFLQLANNSGSATETPTFSELAKMVGETKRPYNDML